MSSTTMRHVDGTGATPPTGGRAEHLAIKFQRANEAFSRFVDGLTEEQWTTRAVNTPGKAGSEDEDRPVGTIAHHLAVAHVAFLARIKSAAEGKSLPTRTGTLAERNAAHAAQNGHLDRVQTAALLRINGAAIVAYVAGLGEEQLDRTTDFGGSRLTIAEIVGDALVGHIHDHELSVRAVVGQPIRLVRKGEGRVFDWGTMSLTLPVGATDSEERLSLLLGSINPGVGNTIMHRHREQEIFYVLEGSVEVGGVRDGRVFTTIARAGDTVDVPSWEPHYWCGSGDRIVKVVVVAMPGGIERYFEEILALDAITPQPGPEAYAALWTKHGHERIDVAE